MDTIINYILKGDFRNAKLEIHEELNNRLSDKLEDIRMEYAREALALDEMKSSTYHSYRDKSQSDTIKKQGELFHSRVLNPEKVSGLETKIASRKESQDVALKMANKAVKREDIERSKTHTKPSAPNTEEVIKKMNSFNPDYDHWDDYGRWDAERKKHGELKGMIGRMSSDQKEEVKKQVHPRLHKMLGEEMEKPSKFIERLKKKKKARIADTKNKAAVLSKLEAESGGM